MTSGLSGGVYTPDGFARSALDRAFWCELVQFFFFVIYFEKLNGFRNLKTKI